MHRTTTSSASYCFFSGNVQTVSIMPCSVLAPEKWQIKANGYLETTIYNAVVSNSCIGVWGNVHDANNKDATKKIVVWFAALCNTHTVYVR